MSRFLTIAVIGLLCVTRASGQHYEERFDALNQRPWRVLFQDSGRDAWPQKWFLDGEKSAVTNTPQGMEIVAGAVPQQDSSHTVLWTRQNFEGDLKIEYDFTRLDKTTTNSVNILYIQATGSGLSPYDKDIALWCDLRREPAMPCYFDHMNSYHISYAVADGASDDYLRGRRYVPETGRGLKGTALTPEYTRTGLFLRNVTYHITVLKIGKELIMKVEGGGQHQTFYFDATPFAPITEGRIGLRLMATRASRFANFVVYGLAPAAL